MTTLTPVAPVYFAYDDSALTTYANTGILRRAQKDILANKVSIIESKVADDKKTATKTYDITLNSDGQTVILPADGLTSASCDCSSVSACKHIVASVLYLQSLAQQADSNVVVDTEVPAVIEAAKTNNKNEKVLQAKPFDVADDQNKASSALAISTSALDEILTFSLTDLQNIAKKIPKVKRLKAMAIALNYFEEGFNGNEEKSQQLGAKIISENNSVRIQLTNQSEEIRYILGAGFEGMLSKIERDASSYHWLGLLAVQSRYAKEENLNPIREWLKSNLLEESSHSQHNLERLSVSTLSLLDDIKFDIEQLLNQGLSHIDSYSANRMHLANTLARSQHLPRLATELRQLSGQMHDFVNGDNHVNERQILLRIAELAAYLYQLRYSTGSSLQLLRGKLRQQYNTDEKRPDLTLLPLGARWWQSQGKARGLTLYFYEPNDSQIIEFTQARGQAQDLNFNKHTAWYNAVWLSAAQNLMNQYSTLANPRFNDNDALAVTGSKVIASKPLKDDFDSYTQSVKALAFDEWRTLKQSWQQQLMLKSTVDELVVLNPAKIGNLVIDEIEQCVWWQLADQADNQIRLRLNWNANAQQSINNIEKLERINLYDVQMIVACVTLSDNVIELSPMTLVMTDELFHLDYSQIPNKKHTLKDLLSGTISKLISKKRRLVEIDNKRLLTLTDLVCEPILTVLDSLSASGRLQPTDNQIKQLRQQQSLANDSGLTVLANPIANLYSNKVTTTRILQLAYLCKMSSLLQAEMPIILQTPK